ncbi:UNVERIFIED_CONTAM: hypothetical protein FKN15_062527 [Acipenser sinensis]
MMKGVYVIQCPCLQFDAYPMPRVDELLDRLGKGEVYLYSGPDKGTLADPLNLQF